jgi:hypothetical protein
VSMRTVSVAMYYIVTRVGAQRDTVGRPSRKRAPYSAHRRSQLLHSTADSRRSTRRVPATAGQRRPSTPPATDRRGHRGRARGRRRRRSRSRR